MSVNDNGCFLIDVPAGALHVPSWLTVYADAVSYEIKDEFHITVIGQAVADAIQAAGRVDEVQDLVKTYDWSATLTQRYVELAKIDENKIHRKSISVWPLSLRWRALSLNFKNCLVFRSAYHQRT